MAAAVAAVRRRRRQGKRVVLEPAVGKPTQVGLKYPLTKGNSFTALWAVNIFPGCHGEECGEML